MDEMSIAIFFIFNKEDILKPNIIQSTKKRLTAILLIFAIIATYILLNIFKISCIYYDEYNYKTYNQITTTSPLIAKRGNIYDANMNLLATSSTKWRIFVSPREIKKAEESDNKRYFNTISQGLSSILNLNESDIHKKITNTALLDVTIKKAASEEEYKKTLDFVVKNHLEDLVFFEASISRYYPEETLAAHLLGFVGSDNQGLYGLEYYYDKILSGTDGYYAYAKDANGIELGNEYSDYVPAEDGYSIVTTIDSYLQNELETILESAKINHQAENRVCGVVMDTMTGAILAMATTSPFNPNTPFVLDDDSAKKLILSGYEYGSKEYNELKNSLLQSMWSNKAISETYEPGSTFKIVTVSAALDCGAASLSDTFSCTGSAQVGGWNIRCHKKGGHGSGFSLAYGLQMSCNPCMISISARTGALRFYSYVKNFGYLEKTGIDLPGEASTIFHSPEGIGETELATASFGQRFKVSIINQITAIAAVANGGKLLTPYVVKEIINSDGKTVFERETETRRQVISEETALTVSKILVDGVNNDGGAKNAGVMGYDVAAKTGTSEKFDILDENGNSYLRIGSTVAYSIDEKQGIAVIIVVDEPTSSVKYGSVVAAPYVSQFLEKALPYLEFKSKSSSTVSIDNYVGLSVEAAKNKLNENKIAYEIVGNGSVVTAQTPTANSIFYMPISKVILYTETKKEDPVTVPKLVGLKINDATKFALNNGLNIRFSGIFDSDCVISYQSLPEGTKVKRGTVITLRAIKTDYED